MSEAREHFLMRRKAFGQNLPNDFMLQYGRDCDMSARTFLGPRGERNACFANAIHRAIHDKRLTYYEGYVFVYGVALQHAWLMDKDDFVVDPTLELKPVGRINAYFGIPFITEYVKRACIANNNYGVLDHFYAGKTAPKLYELGLEAGQAWLLDQPVRRKRNRPTRKAVV